MAGDWLKWRVDLQTHPRFITLANDLIYNEDRIGLLVYVCGEDALDIGVFPPSNKSVTERALRCVTEQALRDVTLSKLMVVWGAVNAHGKVRGNDATMEPMLASEIDHIAGVDGFGAAMEFAGWVREESNNVLVFPNFLEFNEPACLRAKPKSNAERQAEFRARRKAEKEASNDPVTKVTKSNAREEKRREEVLEKEAAAIKPVQAQPLPRSPEEIAKQAEELVKNWTMPPACQDPRFRKLLAKWVASRYVQWGWYDEMKWSACVNNHFHYTAAQWKAALEKSWEGGTAWLAEFKRDKDAPATQAHPPRSTAKELTAP